MSTVIESIKKEILNWPNVTAEPYRFGGLEFRLNKREMACSFYEQRINLGLLGIDTVQME